MIPPFSPYHLIQESLWPDRFMSLVACQLLNCTSRKQVVQVLPEIIKRWPDAASLALADEIAVSDVVASLGFRNRRAKNLTAMAREYSKGPCEDVKTLPGCGEYAYASDRIFYFGDLGDDEPRDGTLGRYWRWTKKASCQ